MLYALITVLLIGLDQLSKFLVKTNMELGSSQELIPGVIQLTYVRNTGAAFSIFSGMRWPLIVITLLVMVFLVYLLLSKKVTHHLGMWSLVAIISGAVGNLIDRVLYGSVVDMFEVLFIRFAVFNIADIFVVCGGIAFCVYFLLYHEMDSAPKAHHED